ncbi:MAG: hypothetical protein ACFFBZ_06290 [Promethearchaeota archaeon]
MKKNNILTGIIISDLISFISYAIFSKGIFFLGDFQMLIGVLWGTYFALKYLKKKRKFFRYGLAVGLGGSFLSAISIFTFEMTLTYMGYDFSLEILFIFLLFFLIEAVIVAVIAGSLIGYYFFLREGQTKKVNAAEEEFFNSLKEP